MRRLIFAFVPVLIALVAMLVGCGDVRESSPPPAPPKDGAGPSSPAAGDPAEARIAYRVSGMKKTASGAT